VNLMPHFGKPPFLKEVYQYFQRAGLFFSPGACLFFLQKRTYFLSSKSIILVVT